MLDVLVRVPLQSIAKWLLSYVWCLQCEYVHFECICLFRCYFVRAIVVTFIILFLANLPSTRVSIRILHTSLYYNYMLYECRMCIGRCSCLYTVHTLHASYFIQQLMFQALCFMLHMQYTYKIRISVSLLAACCFVFFFLCLNSVLILISSFIR